MFVSVRLLNGFERSLIYKVPEHLQQYDLKAKVVQVPLKKEVYAALVEKYVQPSSKFIIRSILSVIDWPKDEKYQSFIQQISYLYQLNSNVLLQRLERHAQHTLDTAVLRDQKKPSCNQSLSFDQQSIVDALINKVKHPTFQVSLIHGVTGSGKTEIYKALIIACLQQSRTALLLLPEVNLAEEFKERLIKELDGCTIISLHSASSVAQKKSAWQHLLHGLPFVFIGVHVPVLMPIANLGLIIIDEEHDTGYQEKKHPKINSKYAALLRAKEYNIPCVLGSATPSMDSLYQVKQKNYAFFQLKKRFSGSFPIVESVSLLQKNVKKREYFWITQPLLRAITECLSSHQQAIIFINRRGYSFFIQCNVCSMIVHCYQCSVSLTLHEDNVLRCHYCDYSIDKPLSCVKCNADETHLLSKGLGTQYIVAILKKLFPAARIARVDKDTSTHKKLWKETIDSFAKGELDILVGTQTLTKGYHFPKVTLVGIIWADIAFHFPWYNAAEVALQQIIQVAGRAGRESAQSKVIVQLMDEHPIVGYITEQDYLKFYAHESVHRKSALYPPYMHLAHIELRNKNQATLTQESQACFEHLNALLPPSVKILGPVKPLVYKVKNYYSKNIYIKSLHLEQALQLFKTLEHNNYESDIFWLPYCV